VNCWAHRSDEGGAAGIVVLLCLYEGSSAVDELGAALKSHGIRRSFPIPRGRDSEGANPARTIRRGVTFATIVTGDRSRKSAFGMGFFKWGYQSKPDRPGGWIH